MMLVVKQCQPNLQAQNMLQVEKEDMQASATPDNHFSIVCFALQQHCW